MSTTGGIAILGGGISGVTAAWQLARLGLKDVTLYESTDRLGGTVETIRTGGFIIEGGPDGWVSEKPWARELAEELGLGAELIGSLDEQRVTYIVQDGKLVAMPDAMRMMVPTDIGALRGSVLFSAAAIQAYEQEAARADELKATAPDHDESVAEFVHRHFGEEVLTKIGGPLLSGVFGGDVTKLSVRAVMPKFVEMEHTSGSLVRALDGVAAKARGSVFTSLAGGVGSLVEKMVEEIPAAWVRLSTVVSSIKREGERWRVTSLGDGAADTKDYFDAVIVALPAPVARALVRPVSARTAELLTLETSSAVLAALAFDQEFELPRGFGFLVPEGEGSGLLAGTFVDQKFPERVPTGCRLLRGFFGGELGVQLAAKSDQVIADRTLSELRNLLGPLPDPIFSVVRRWPRSLPQYGVGHLERMAELDALVKQLPGLWLLGNAYRGVGLPDLVRDARAASRELSQQ
jgi:oxygen-dependent protoporphyrinogen oxidase